MLLNLATKDSGGDSCVVQEVVWNKRVSDFCQSNLTLVNYLASSLSYLNSQA